MLRLLCSVRKRLGGSERPVCLPLHSESRAFLKLYQTWNARASSSQRASVVASTGRFFERCAGSDYNVPTRVQLSGYTTHCCVETPCVSANELGVRQVCSLSCRHRAFKTCIPPRNAAGALHLGVASCFRISIPSRHVHGMRQIFCICVWFRFRDFNIRY